MTDQIPSHQLHFPQLDRAISCRSDESLFHSARRQGVRIVGACGGRGTCGSCLVRVSAGEVEVLADTPTKTADKWQRSCRLTPRTDLTLEVAPRSLAPVVRAEGEDDAREILPLDSPVIAEDVRLPAASLEDPRADLDRLMQTLGSAAMQVDLAAARGLPALLREDPLSDSWALRAWRHGDEWIRFGRPGEPSPGLAIDLGTTNIAAFLIDLASGERLASLGLENPQTGWGADVISRVNAASRDAACAEELRQAAVTAINALAHDLCQSLGMRSEQLVDISICGNTAMHHLLLGLPVRQLGRAPFVAVQRDSLDVKARELGIEAAPGARVHLVPNVGGFIGGDHVTALLATEELWAGGRSTLVMDIGTNTEISLIHQGRIFSASAPSGPALEGGHIACGMRAADGAIERVRWNGEALELTCIGQVAPVGLCGSGVLDALAACYRGGLLNPQGRIGGTHPAVIAQDGKRLLQLAPEVFLGQQDVRAVQLAKAAIRTASDLLLEEAGLSAEQLDAFVIAGAFGAYIDVASGIALGLFPDLPRESFHQVGNAAGLGIRRLLASCRARERARQLAAQCTYLELNSRRDFQQRFLDNIGFPPLENPSL